MDPLSAGIMAAGAIGGGLLGGSSGDQPRVPGQRQITQMMKQIAGNPLSYTGPQAITSGALEDATRMQMDISPALDYTQRVLSGDFMNNNPYLDTAFSNAAGNVRQQLDTQFARAGRMDSDAHMNAMGSSYNQLADQIYGNAYAQERAYMDNAAAMLPNMYGQNINNLQGLLSIGNRQDQAVDEMSNWDTFDAYKRLQMMQSAQGLLPQQTYQNTGAGAIGGALAGMQIGSGLYDAFNKPATPGVG